MGEAAAGTVVADPVLVAITLFTAVMLAVSAVLAAAAAYLRIRNHRKARRWTALEERWEPLMLEVLAGGPPSAIYHAVEPGDKRYFLGFLLRYARRIRGAELEAIRALAAPFLPGLAGDLARGSAERRARAVHSLATLGIRRHTGTVVAALDDPSPLVAMIAATALLRETRHEHLEAVLAALPRFAGWSRMFLARALAGAGSGAAPSLRRILADGSVDPATRAVAAEALRELLDLDAADVAARVAAEAGDPELVAVCLGLLAEIGRPEHLTVVTAHFRSDDPVVRRAAARALAALGGPDEREDLAELLVDPSPWVALQAARGLSEMGERDALARLARTEGPRGALAAEMLAAG